MQRQKGFVLLMLVVVIAIGAIIYMGVLGNFSNSQSPGNSEQPIWQQQWRLDRNSPERKEAMKKARQYISQKPAIENNIVLAGQASIDGDPRGRIVLEFAPPDEVRGSWKAVYTHDNTQFTIQAKFDGITDPTNTLQTSEGPAPQRLYFYTRGSYTLRSHNRVSGVESDRQGTAYAAGWLAQDLTWAEGQITLTDNEKGSGTYQIRLQQQSP